MQQVNEAYNETLLLIETKRKELENSNQKYKDDFILKYYKNSEHIIIKVLKN